MEPIESRDSPDSPRPDHNLPASTLNASSPLDPKLPLYRSGSWAARTVTLAGILGVFITLVSIALAVSVVWPPPRRENAQAILFALAGVWGVGGPMWFFSEYFFIYRRAGTAGSWEQFKHGQQVSAAIWAGLSVSLAALGVSDLAKPEPDRWTCELQSKTDLALGSKAEQLLITNCKKTP